MKEQYNFIPLNYNLKLVHRPVCKLSFTMTGGSILPTDTLELLIFLKQMTEKSKHIPVLEVGACCQRRLLTDGLQILGDEPSVSVP